MNTYFTYLTILCTLTNSFPPFFSLFIYMRRCLSQRLFPRSVFPFCSTHLGVREAQLAFYKFSPHLHLRFRTQASASRAAPSRPRKNNTTTRRPLLSSSTQTSSSSSYLLVFAVACGGAILFDYLAHHRYRRAHDREDSTHQHRVLAAPPENTNDPFYTDMTIPPGHLGNLTPEQETKLREFWSVTLKVFGVEDPQQVSGTDTPQTDEALSVSELDIKDKKKSKKRLGLFKRHEDKESSNGSATPTKDSSSHHDSEDKYGQVKEFQQILATQSPESLRATFWSMVKADHPDGLLLRFLRARKWDVDKALVMLVSTMRWRSQEQHVDDDVVLRGEGGALEDTKSSDPAVKREGEDFLAQLRLGKSFLHGTDKEGRPLCHVRVRLHRGGEQTERSLERYTVYVIETARLALRPPVETAVSIPIQHTPRRLLFTDLVASASFST